MFGRIKFLVGLKVGGLRKSPWVLGRYSVVGDPSPQVSVLANPWLRIKKGRYLTVGKLKSNSGRWGCSSGWSTSFDIGRRSNDSLWELALGRQLISSLFTGTFNDCISFSDKHASRNISLQKDLQKMANSEIPHSSFPCSHGINNQNISNQRNNRPQKELGELEESLLTLPIKTILRG